jgi:hypothetical protein
VLAAARALQLLGLVITGVGFFTGLLGGNTRLELVLLAVGAGIFFVGRAIRKK